METTKSPQPLAEFGITALHGERNIRIRFDGVVKIIVAENGYGKTTILNSLYALLFGNYEKLRSIQFETIYLKFKSGYEVSLAKSDFSLNFERAPQSGMLQHLKSFLLPENLQNLYEDYRTFSATKIRTSTNFISAYQETQKRFPNLPAEHLIGWLDGLKNEMGNVDLYCDKLMEARKNIQNEFQFDPIYLPTYRRIEEDLKNLTGIPVGLDIDANVIQFGMNDVQISFDRITGEIKHSSMEWFSKVNGQMLGQLINGIALTEDMKTGLGDRVALEIVLERIGNNMPPGDKAQILQMTDSEEILKHEALAYFLANLVKVYERQKENDNAIKKFSEICNKYLVNKRVAYDESAVNISIKRNKNDEEVDIKTLSSGEKQIISLFSRLFLTKSKQVAIFFDEPELSLSIEWQKHLLPDIIQSGICGFIFCTTHSPFIFENDLIGYASDLSKYIEEIE
jgi:predicted ATPase